MQCANLRDWNNKKSTYIFESIFLSCIFPIYYYPPEFFCKSRADLQVFQPSHTHIHTQHYPRVKRWMNELSRYSIFGLFSATHASKKDSFLSHFTRKRIRFLPLLSNNTTLIYFLFCCLFSSEWKKGWQKSMPLYFFNINSCSDWERRRRETEINTARGFVWTTSCKKR